MKLFFDAWPYVLLAIIAILAIWDYTDTKMRIRKQEKKLAFYRESRKSQVTSFDQIRQDHADMQYEHNARREGFEMFLQWRDAQHSEVGKKIMQHFDLMEYNPMLITTPRQFLHMQYTKSKWETGDYHCIKLEEFERLKKEYHDANAASKVG